MKIGDVKISAEAYLIVQECDTETSSVQAATLFKRCYKRRTLNRAWQQAKLKETCAGLKKNILKTICFVLSLF